ncbi:MAG: NAD(P)H-hydrate dehydratase [Lachnospiraceae bacterium]|nr:NAD(P)H-hydrate dehydratase [Lachnospiraceae bacterium]
MEYLVTAEEMKRYDAVTIEQIGIPSLVLMERASLSVYEEIQAAKLSGQKKRVLILVGCGNNGADGLALARMLSSGFQVEVVILGNQEKATEEWKIQYEILRHFPVRTGRKTLATEYDILIDAIFGVGLSREVSGEYAEMIEWFNQAEGWKIAVDVPSGIHSDTGRIMGCAVKVDLTVCFAFGKRGLFYYPGCEYAGKVVIKDIGIGKEAFEGKIPGMFRYTEKIGELLPIRQNDGNKGTFGKVLLAAGTRNMAGAAVLSAKSCYRVGAGMVKVLTPECNRVILQTAVPEALLATSLPEAVSEEKKQFLQWADVLAIGPGLGTDERAYQILYTFLKESRLPMVIDADGLNLLSRHEELLELMREQGMAGREFVLTPHVGELARLCKTTIDKVKDSLLETSLSLAQKLNCVIVSKDARTLVCKNGEPVCMNTVGNSGMAVAGSGDVLTGIIAGLIAQGVNTWKAATLGVYLHGLAGDVAADRLGRYGMTACDLAEVVAEVTK